MYNNIWHVYINNYNCLSLILNLKIPSAKKTIVKYFGQYRKDVTIVSLLKFVLYYWRIWIFSVQLSLRAKPTGWRRYRRCWLGCSPYKLLETDQANINKQNNDNHKQSCNNTTNYGCNFPLFGFLILRFPHGCESWNTIISISFSCYSLVFWFIDIFL